MTQKLFNFGLRWTVIALFTMWFIPLVAVVRAQPAPATAQYLSPNQLDDLVAPIALYPDPLLSQILVAATYPLDVVEASQWLQRNPNLSGRALTQAVERQDWDASIQALVAFPETLDYLTEDIAWTTSLGDAFLAQEGDVMDAVQRMRARAAASGKLLSTSQQLVTRTYEAGRPVYVIVPASPDIIYVPVYDPFWVWGTPLYYRYPRWNYPARASAVYFSRGISVQLYFGSGWDGWSSWGWRPRWTDRTVIVNNTFIQRQNFSTTHLSSFSGTSTWSHDSTHRRGVPYPTAALTERFRNDGRSRDSRDSRDSDGRRESSGQVRSVPAPVQHQTGAPERRTSPSNNERANNERNDHQGQRSTAPSVSARADNNRGNSTTSWNGASHRTAPEASAISPRPATQPPTQAANHPDRGAAPTLPPSVRSYAQAPAPAREPVPNRSVSRVVPEPAPVVRQSAPTRESQAVRNVPAPSSNNAHVRNDPAPSRQDGGHDKSRENSKGNPKGNRR